MIECCVSNSLICNQLVFNLMPVYHFEALGADGNSRKGVMEADSSKAARGLLRAQALVPIKVEQVSAHANAGIGSQKQRHVFSATALTLWTRQLAGLVSSGLPLERALTSLSDESENPLERELVATLRAEVNGGAPFAKALAQHRVSFPTFL